MKYIYYCIGCQVWGEGLKWSRILSKKITNINIFLKQLETLNTSIEKKVKRNYQTKIFNKRQIGNYD